MPRGPPRMVMPVMGMVVVVVLLAAIGPGDCEGFEQYEDEEYEDGCHPEEADACFKDVNDNLLCNLGKPTGRNCTNRNAVDLCESMSDALDCCEDIMDTCSEDDGLETFYVWLSGLRGVYQHLCVEDEYLELISDLLRGSNCFRLKRFITCVEDRANLTHVADLLTTDLDLQECNQLQVSVAACIEDSEKNRGKCRGKAQAVNEALIVFFSTTACGHAPPPPPTPSPMPCLPPTTSASRQDGASTVEQDNSNNRTSNENSSGNNNSNNNPSSTTTTNASNSNSDSDDTTTTTTTTTTTSNAQESTRNTSSSNEESTTTISQSSSSSSTKAAPISTSKPQACQQTQKDLANSGTPTASTIVVTVLVTVVVVGLAAMVLLKRGVLTIRTDFDRRLIGLQDNETNSAYDRF